MKLDVLFAVIRDTFLSFLVVTVLFVLGFGVPDFTREQGSSSLSSYGPPQSGEPQLIPGFSDNQTKSKTVVLNPLSLYFGLLIACSISGFVAWISGVLDRKRADRASMILAEDFQSGGSKTKHTIDFLFGRSQIFKNSVRGWIPFQAFIVTNNIFIFGALAFGVVLTFCAWITNLNRWDILNDFLTDQLAKGQVVPGAFWISVTYITTYLAVMLRINHDLHEKWKYCASLFNEYLKNPENKRLKAALAIDLLHLDLWARRSFGRFFKEELRAALYGEMSSGLMDGETFKTKMDGIEIANTSEREAENWLENHFERQKAS